MLRSCEAHSTERVWHCQQVEAQEYARPSHDNQASEQDHGFEERERERDSEVFQSNNHRIVT